MAGELDTTTVLLIIVVLLAVYWLTTCREGVRVHAEYLDACGHLAGDEGFMSPRYQGFMSPRYTEGMQDEMKGDERRGVVHETESELKTVYGVPINNPVAAPPTSLAAKYGANEPTPVGNVGTSGTVGLNWEPNYRENRGVDNLQIVGAVTPGDLSLHAKEAGGDPVLGY